MSSMHGGSVYLFCDGSTGATQPGGQPAARPAAGRRTELQAGCGAAVVAYGADGALLGFEVQALPPMTNNEAEYAGLLLGIRLAVRLGCREPVFILDSEIVAGQMTGRCAVNSAGLRRWHWRAIEALRHLPSARFCTIPREWNRAADGLAAQAGLPWGALLGRVGQGAGAVAADGAHRAEAADAARRS